MPGREIVRTVGVARVGAGAMTAQLSAEQIEWLHQMLDLARAGQTDALAGALDAGLPVNLTSSTGDSLLMLAAYHGHIDTVRLLLERGADTARINDHGQTALAAATYRRNQPIVTALLAAGADPALGPRSALEIARFFDLTQMAELLRSARRTAVIEG